MNDADRKSRNRMSIFSKRGSVLEAKEENIEQKYEAAIKEYNYSEKEIEDLLQNKTVEEKKEFLKDSKNVSISAPNIRKSLNKPITNASKSDKVLSSLMVLTESVNGKWVTNFGEQGVQGIFKHLSYAQQENLPTKALYCMKIIQNLLNFRKIFNLIINNDEYLKSLCKTMDMIHTRLMDITAVTLAALCTFDHRKVLEAISKTEHEDPVERFYFVISAIKFADYAGITSVLKLINAILNTDDLYYRVTIRNELNNLGFKSTIESKIKESFEAKEQYMNYIDSESEDNNSYYGRKEHFQKIIGRENLLFEYIVESSENSGAARKFKSILQHIFMMIATGKNILTYLGLIEIIVGQITSSNSENVDPKYNLISEDINLLIQSFDFKEKFEKTKGINIALAKHVNRLESKIRKLKSKAGNESHKNIPVAINLALPQSRFDTIEKNLKMTQLEQKIQKPVLDKPDAPSQGIIQSDQGIPSSSPGIPPTCPEILSSGPGTPSPRSEIPHLSQGTPPPTPEVPPPAPGMAPPCPGVPPPAPGIPLLAPGRPPPAPGMAPPSPGLPPPAPGIPPPAPGMPPPAPGIPPPAPGIPPPAPGMPPPAPGMPPPVPGMPPPAPGMPPLAPGMPPPGPGMPPPAPGMPPPAPEMPPPAPGMPPPAPGMPPPAPGMPPPAPGMPPPAPGMPPPGPGMPPPGPGMPPPPGGGISVPTPGLALGPPGRRAMARNRQNNLPKKIEHKTSKPMKKIGWTKLPNRRINQASIWIKMNEEELFDDKLLLDVEGTFSQPDRKETKEVIKNVKKGPSFHVIDAKLGQNIGILLNSSKLKPLQAASFIEEFSDRIDISFIETLSKTLPEDSMMQQLKVLSLPNEDCHGSEIFCREISKIKYLTTKMQDFIFIKKYPEIYGVSKSVFDLTKNAANAIKLSENFDKFLSFCLLIGNILNSGTSSGKAVAIDLSSILKMNDLKSTDNTVSLMLFIAQQIETKHPEVGNFVYELDFVIQASKVSYQDAKKNFDDISKSLTKLKISYQKIKEEEPSSKYNDIVSEFLKDSVDEIQELTEIDELIQKSYDKILTKLSLDKKKYDLSAIISTIAKITMNYMHAKEEYKKKRLAEERKNSHKKSNTGGTNNVSKFTSKADSNISEDRQNLMSDLMSSLNNPRAKKNKIKNH